MTILTKPVKDATETMSPDVAIAYAAEELISLTEDAKKKKLHFQRHLGILKDETSAYVWEDNTNYRLASCDSIWPNRRMYTPSSKQRTNGLYAWV